MRKASNNNGGPHTSQHSFHNNINILFKPEEIWTLSGIEQSSLLNDHQWKSHCQYKSSFADTTDWYELETMSPLWQHLYQLLIHCPYLDSPYYSPRGSIIIWIINNSLLCLAPTRFFLISQTKNENERVISLSLGK